MLHGFRNQLHWYAQKLRPTSLGTLRRSHQQANPTPDCPHRPEEESPTLPHAWEWAPALPALLLGWGLALPAWEQVPALLSGWGTTAAYLGLSACTACTPSWLEGLALPGNDCLDDTGTHINIFNSFYFGRMWWSWKNWFLTVSMLGGCGGLDRTDF